MGVFLFYQWKIASITILVANVLQLHKKLKKNNPLLNY